MIKKIVSLVIFAAFCMPAFAIDKIAFVDVQKVVNSSAQVKALRNEQNAKRKEMAEFLKKAGSEIKAQTDDKKRQALTQKYDKELKAKQEANAKAYKTKLIAIDKSISGTINAQAKAMGYDLVLVKGSVLYGGDDITDAVIKAVK